MQQLEASRLRLAQLEQEFKQARQQVATMNDQFQYYRPMYPEPLKLMDSVVAGPVHRWGS